MCAEKLTEKDERISLWFQRIRSEDRHVANTYELAIYSSQLTLVISVDLGILFKRS